jgi:hypothetical protein
MNTTAEGTLMPRGKKPTDEQIDQATDLRAKGSSWEAVAQELGLPASTLRLWPTTQADRWAPSFHRAETDVFTEAVAEAVRALRKQLRSDEPVDVRDAAKQLLGFHLQLQKLMQTASGGETTTMDALLEEIAHDLGQSKQVRRRAGKDGGSCAA